MLRRLHSLLPNPRCLFCLGDTDTGLEICRHCMTHLPFNFNACRHCGAALTVPGDICGACLLAPPPMTRTLAPFVYANPISRLITRLKYGGNLQGAGILGELLAAWARERIETPQLLIPMPLHPRRLRRRGFNQALELARPLSRSLGIPLDNDLCVRHRDTAQQTGLHKKQRRANVRGAFSLRGTPAARHLALIDDVMTTGSTARELTRVLLRAGAQRVDVWVVARAESR